MVRISLASSAAILLCVAPDCALAAAAVEGECAAGDATCASGPTTNDTNGETGGLGPEKPNAAEDSGVGGREDRQRRGGRSTAATTGYTDHAEGAGGDSGDEGGDSGVEGATLPPGQCGLYLAPSSIPYAGLGLFSGTDIPSEASINEYLGGTFEGYNDNDDPPLWTDLFVPVADHYKAAPYRGQQRFPSWLSYVWPERPGAFSDFDTMPFPTVPRGLWDFDAGLDGADGLRFFADDWNDDRSYPPDFEPRRRVSAFAPGVATLANHGGGWGGWGNIDRIGANSRADFDGQEAPWHPGAGAFTPHHKIEFKAREDVRAGMELLLNYGRRFNKNLERKVDHLHTQRRKAEKAGESLADTRPRRGFVDGIHKKWDLLDHRIRQSVPDELPTEKAKREATDYGFARDWTSFEEGERPYSEYRKNDYPVRVEEEEVVDDYDVDAEWWPSTAEDITKPLPWLASNGVCLSSGKLRVKSSSVQYAGRGVFSTAKITKGEAVLSTPLVAMREEDFVIYKADPGQKFWRNVLDKDTVVGTELLLNYAFSHPDSPLYLVPSAPLANFINNGGPPAGTSPEAEGANVQVAWPRGNAARLFEWAYSQKHKSHFDGEFDPTELTDPNPWLRDHPIDVMERSGKLALEFVALRDIAPGEEILIDYGPLWDAAWSEFRDRNPYARGGYFRHSIGVPDGFFPDNWLNVGDTYELAELADLENNPPEPGVALPLTWAHNGKAVASKYAYVVGLPKGFSDKFREWSESKGIIELYRRLLTEQEGFLLESDGFKVYQPGSLVNTTTEEEKATEYFAHRYKSSQWNFNMHFVGAWEEAARKDILSALGDFGFDLAIKGIGERFGYDNMTCFHASYMGMTHCDKSKMHSDIYATEDKSWNIVFPLITVEGTDPELDVLAEDINTVIAVHYLKDIAYAMGDFGYHQTRPSDYFDPERDSVDGGSGTPPLRVVFGAYCSQIDATNIAVIRQIYDGDDPAPFADQFKVLPMGEAHWEKGRASSTLASPGGMGY